MANFFKKIVDKISGYPEDTDGEYYSDNDYDETAPDQYGYAAPVQGFSQPKEQQLSLIHI